ncbi:hypothetical protein DFH08DRAFT_807076 [Mycena albidolilacea]|uniref:Uncharacterized protein n=1 Tax=Mycena albidolilacea TaxID=1033008 RepID=A0AAD7EU48_9AGAR|nr:hypothetical protein DFH08DRAFT_807076 [Mycena albidolilacea]
MPSAPKFDKPLFFDPWVAIRSLDPPMQGIAFALANQQLVNNIMQDHVANFLAAYITSLQQNITQNPRPAHQNWYPSDHLLFTYGLRFAVELVDPQHKEKSLGGISWLEKTFSWKELLLTPLSAKGKAKGKAAPEDLPSRKCLLSPSAEENSKKKPHQSKPKVVITNEVVSEDNPPVTITAVEKARLNKVKKDKAAGLLLHRPEDVPVISLKFLYFNSFF